MLRGLSFFATSMSATLDAAPEKSDLTNAAMLDARWSKVASSRHKRTSPLSNELESVRNEIENLTYRPSVVRERLSDLKGVRTGLETSDQTLSASDKPEMVQVAPRTLLAARLMARIR